MRGLLLVASVSRLLVFHIERVLLCKTLTSCILRERSQRRKGLAEQKEYSYSRSLLSSVMQSFCSQNFTLQSPLNPPKSYGFCFLSTLAYIRDGDGERMVITFSSFFKVLGNFLGIKRKVFFLTLFL